jgi:tetratricopeptide (TPR) repeat protein
VKHDSADPEPYSQLFREAQALVQKGKAEKAVSAVRTAQQEDPNHWYLNYLLGWTYQAAGHSADAGASYHRAHLLNRENALVKAALGQWHLTVGDAARAVPLFEDCVKTWPESSEAHSFLGLSHLGEGELDRAELAFREAIRLGSNNPDARFGMAAVYERTGRSSSLGDLYRDYIESAPDLPSGHAFLADHLFFETGNAVDAFPHYEKALRLAGKTSHQWLAQYVSTSGYPMEIVRSYLMALEAAGYWDLAAQVARDQYRDGDYLDWKAHQLEAFGDIEGARQELSRVVRDHPESYGRRLRLGLLEMRGGDYKAAERELRRALEEARRFGDRDPWYWAALAVAFEAQGKPYEATEILSEAGALDKARLQAALQVINGDLGNWTAVLEHTAHALATDPSDGQAIERAARAHEGMGRIEDAINALRRLVALQPKNGHARLELGEILLKAGRPAEALSIVDEILRSRWLSSPQMKAARVLRREAATALRKDIRPDPVPPVSPRQRRQ